MFRNHILPFCFLFVYLIISCKQNASDIGIVYYYSQPVYDSIQLVKSTDTLHFALKEDIYTEIKSFNLFYQNGTPFISFYDERSQSINIYNFNNQQISNRIKLKKIFKKQHFYKTSVFVRSLDSIFIINDKNIGLYDSHGKQMNNIAFLDNPKHANATLDNNNLLLLEGTKAYAIVRPNVNDRSIKALKEWKVLYTFDLKKNEAQLYYHLPDIYRKYLYGYHFLDYNYCYNNHGNFVFSFPADTTIYETNLRNYHHAYFARSQFQKEDIKPVTKEALENNQGFKEYSTRDSYGSIFFDPFRKYYLRFVKHKITETEFLTKSRKRRETVLIFNSDFKIIGESEWEEGVSFDSIFFTNDGQIYTRTNFQDENALHFVRLSYHPDHPQSIQLPEK